MASSHILSEKIRTWYFNTRRHKALIRLGAHKSNDFCEELIGQLRYFGTSLKHTLVAPALNVWFFVIVAYFCPSWPSSGMSLVNACDINHFQDFFLMVLSKNIGYPKTAMQAGKIMINREILQPLTLREPHFGPHFALSRKDFSRNRGGRCDQVELGSS